jgi:hypothetical protein
MTRRRLSTAAISTVVFAVMVAALWVATELAARHDRIVAARPERVIAHAPPPTPTKPWPLDDSADLIIDQLLSPPLDSRAWTVTPKKECELLRDREEARLCVQYPLRESILNSAVLGAGPVPPALVRYKPDRRKTCPIIAVAPGELRAVVCGRLAEQYELYCCN